jgi:putative DNA primase/helicase
MELAGPFGREAAAEGLSRCLETLLDEFAFDDAWPASKSVAMAALMTPFVRPHIPTSPIFLVTAARRGSGKTMLANAVGNLATGRDAAMMLLIPGRQSEEALRLDYFRLIYGGETVINIDNVREDPRSNALCALTTAATVEGKVHYVMDYARVPNRATVIMTGNNVRFGDDLIRRALACVLTPRPGDFHYRHVNLAERVLAARVPAMAAVIRAVKGYVDWNRLPEGSLSGEEKELREKIKGLPRCGFDVWGQMVRNPLVWLGYPDPWGAMAYNQANDVSGQAMDAVKEPWSVCFGEWETDAIDVIARAANHAFSGRPEDKDLHDAIVAAIQTRNPRFTPYMLAADPVQAAAALGYFIKAHDASGSSPLSFVKTEGRRRASYRLCRKPTAN